MATRKIYLKWEEVSKVWEESQWLWEDVSIFVEIDRVVGGSGGYWEYVKNNPWERLRKDIGKEKTERVIKIYCQVRGIDYEKTVIKEKKDIKVTAGEFERFVKEMISIKIDI